MKYVAAVLIYIAIYIPVRMLLQYTVDKKKGAE